MDQDRLDPAEAEARQALREKLSDRVWRFKNLYRVQNEDGDEVQFDLLPAQELFDDEVWTRNIILKSRQHGFTTYACIRALDMALFRSNTACGIIFHKKEDAIQKFRSKILYAYDHLPAWLRAEIRITKRDESSTLELANGSSVLCTSSGRGHRFQYLHISELGPMVATFPARAEEVTSGALNAVGPDAIVTIESTAMGAWGDFYDRCQRAMVKDRLVESGESQLTRLDYKFFFFAWWQDNRNVLSAEDTAAVSITKEQQDYFDTIEARYECRIFPNQRAWYVVKLEEQKDKMLREHPSTPEEAFQGSVEGAYYAVEMAAIEREGRICDLPFIPTLPVYTFWDIGRDDATAIWVMQQVGPWYHFLRYYEANHTSAAHYANVLAKWRDEFGYRYACHYLPHDAGVSDWSRTDNKTRREVVADMQIGPVDVVERIEVLADGIEMTRQLLARCKFDKTGCGENPAGSGRGGLPSLRAYRKKHDEKSKTWSEAPIKSWANHGADAIRQCAQGFDKPPEQPTDSAAARRRKRQRERRVRTGMTA